MLYHKFKSSVKKINKLIYAKNNIRLFFKLEYHYKDFSQIYVGAFRKIVALTVLQETYILKYALKVSKAPCIARHEHF